MSDIELFKRKDNMNIKAQFTVLFFITILTISSCTNEKSFNSTATPTYTTIPTITLTPTATVTPTATPNPLPEWAQALPEGTNIVVSPTGEIVLSRLSWLYDVGVTDDEYKITFDSENLQINAFDINEELPFDKPIFQATYNNEEKAWNGKFDIYYVILLARIDCEPTDYIVYDEWLKNPKKRLDYDKIPGYPKKISYYVQNLFFTQIHLHEDDYHGSVGFFYVLIDGKNGCWGANDKDFFSYRKKNNRVAFFPIFHLSGEESAKLFLYPVP